MMDDPFLEALAQGGFQVEELARMEYPDGFLIEENDWNYNLLVEQTEDLLLRENVVIFEAAFRYENLFIRTDILVKKGNKVELIEVKAKSYNPFDENIFIGKRGGMVPSWKPYLFDVALQKTPSFSRCNLKSSRQLDSVGNCSVNSKIVILSCIL